MRQPQRIVLLAGVLLIMAAAVCPPWRYSMHLRSEYPTQYRSAGYSFITSPPSMTSIAPINAAFGTELTDPALRFVSVQVDESRLIVELTALAALTVFGFLLAGLFRARKAL